MRQYQLFRRTAVCTAMAVASIVFSTGTFVQADSTDGEQYLVLGQDLKESEQETVLAILGVEDMSNYKVAYTTHEDEVEYLGDYLDASVIGTRALSSVLLTKTEEGSGIDITTANISYCTQEMYRNALITAGIEDIDAKVAGPFSISGTAALVSMMKSYELITGQKLDSTAIDAANNELVTTAQLGESIGKEEAAGLIAALKKEMFEDNGVTIKNIDDALDTLSENMDIHLAEEDKEKIVDLMADINKVDINVDAIKAQAGALYDKVMEIADRVESEDNVLNSIGSFFGNIINSIINFFKNLFS